MKLPLGTSPHAPARIIDAEQTVIAECDSVEHAAELLFHMRSIEHENRGLRAEVNQLRKELGWARKYAEWENQPSGGSPGKGG
jgi:hypothetical protein